MVYINFSSTIYIANVQNDSIFWQKHAGVWTVVLTLIIIGREFYTRSTTELIFFSVFIHDVILNVPGIFSGGGRLRYGTPAAPARYPRVRGL